MVSVRAGRFNDDLCPWANFDGDLEVTMLGRLHPFVYEVTLLHVIVI